MKNNIFRKKFNDLGPSVTEKLDTIFEGETKSESEFVQKFRNLSSKARKTAIKIAGAGLVSLLVLSGFAGCVDKNGDIHETTVEQSPETETPSSVLNQYTTTSSPEQTNQPEETTKRPEEITKGPEETTRGPEETTTKPAETTGKPEEITTPSITEPSTTEEITTAPIVTPVEPEKLPGYDKDYVYPAALTNFVAQHISAPKIKIVYVQPIPYAVVYDDKYRDYYIYVECYDENDNITSYRRMDFAFQDSNLGNHIWFKRNFSSYSNFINTLTDYIQKDPLVNVRVSKDKSIGLNGYNIRCRAVDTITAINKTDMSKFAKILGDNYVDAKVFYMTFNDDIKGFTFSDGRSDYAYTITGFAYTADGKCECFTIQTQPPTYFQSVKYYIYYDKPDLILQDMASGKLTRTDMNYAEWLYFKTFTRPIEDVFVPTTQAEQFEQQV